MVKIRIIAINYQVLILIADAYLNRFIATV